MDTAILRTGRAVRVRYGYCTRPSVRFATADTRPCHDYSTVTDASMERLANVILGYRFTVAALPDGWFAELGFDTLGEV